MNALSPSALLESANLSAPADDATITDLAAKMLAGEQRLADWDADRCELTTEEASDISSETGRQADMLMTMEPRSLTALAAKVRAFRLAFHSMVVTEPGDTIETACDFKDQLAWSVFGDVLRLTGMLHASNPDAGLLALCDEVTAIDAESERLYAACPEEGGTEAWEAYEVYTALTVPRWQSLMHEIAAMPSRSPIGLRAKAEAARKSMPKHRRDDPEPYENLALSLIADVLGEGYEPPAVDRGDAA